MDHITRLVNKNDYSQLRELLNDNPNQDIDNNIVIKCIKYDIFECFNVLLNYINFDNEEFNSQQLKNAKLYNKKNNDSKYIDRLLNAWIDRNVNPKYIDFVNIYKYNVDKFEEYINIIENKYAHNRNYMYEFLVKLLNDKIFKYFLKLFEKYLTKDEQFDLVKNKIYCDEYKEYLNKAFTYFLQHDDKIFDYNTLMCSTVDDLIKYNLVSLLVGTYSGVYDNFYKQIISYLEKNPIDFSILNDMSLETFKQLRFTDIHKIDETKKPLIKNCPPFQLFKNSFYTDNKCKFFIKHLIGGRLLYRSYKLGIRYDVYGNFSADDLIKYTNNTLVYAGRIYEIVTFANTINQHMPDDIKQVIHNVCDRDLTKTIS
jgi:hypothetical protein